MPTASFGRLLALRGAWFALQALRRHYCWVDAAERRPAVARLNAYTVAVLHKAGAGAALFDYLDNAPSRNAGRAHARRSAQAEDWAGGQAPCARNLLIQFISYTKVDKAAFEICRYKRHPQCVANFQAVRPVVQFAFDRRRNNPNPNTCIRIASDNRIKGLTDARFKQQYRFRLAQLPFHFLSRGCLFRTMECDGSDVCFGIR